MEGTLERKTESRELGVVRRSGAAASLVLRPWNLHARGGCYVLAATPSRHVDDGGGGGQRTRVYPETPSWKECAGEPAAPPIWGCNQWVSVPPSPFFALRSDAPSAPFALPMAACYTFR